jgi:hypothetical protein
MIRQRRSALFALAALTVSFAACGGEAPPPNTGAKPVASVAAGAKTPVNEDRSPVEVQPAGTLLDVHIGAPRKIAKTVQGWLPGADPIDIRSLLADLSTPELARIVDLDAPVDWVLTMPVGKGKKAIDDTRSVIAFGVANDVDVESVLKGAYTIETSPDGMRRLVHVKNNGSSSPVCGVAPALGVTKYRLVCAFADSGHAGAALGALYPWLARGVTRRPEPASSAHATIDVAAVRAVAGDDLKQARGLVRAGAVGLIDLDKPNLRKALSHLAEDAIDDVFDFVDETATISLDLNAKETGLDTQLGFSFTGQKSWIARALTTSADVTGGAPASLAKLPAPALQFASWSKASPSTDALIGSAQKALSDVVIAFATDYKVAPKDKDALLEWLRAAALRSVDSAFAMNRSAKASTKPPEKGLPSVLRYFTNKSTSVVVSDLPIKDVLAAQRATADVLSRPVFATLLGLFDLKEAKDLKIAVKRKELALKGLPKGSQAERLELTLSGLPAFTEEKHDGDTSAFPEATKSAAPSPKPKGKATPTKPAAKEPAAPKPKLAPPLTLVFDYVVVPDGDGRTWMASGWGADDGELVDLVVNAMAGKANPALGARADFADFIAPAGMPTGGAWMLTYDWLARELAALDRATKSGSKDDREVEALLAIVPDRGRGAIGFKTAAKRNGAGAFSQIEMMIPRDIFAFGMLAAKPSASGAPTSPASVPPSVP